MTALDLQIDGPDDADWTLALAHGAGAGMDTPFMTAVAEGLAVRGLRVVRFEFAYMAQRRIDDRKRPPAPQARLLAEWQAVVAALASAPGRLAIGGKSMGGRMASLLAADPSPAIDRVAALVCLGYPFHPPGRPERLRTEHLATLATPTLIVQGSRDSFGTRDEVAGYDLSPAIRLHWAEDGNHDLAPRKASGRTAGQNLDEAVAAVADFLRGLA